MNHTARYTALLALLLGQLATPDGMAATAGYAIQDRLALSGDGKWDYASIDASHQRLYVTHGNQVQVLDLATHKAAGAIAGTEGVHGVAFAPELNLGFTSNGRSDSVTVFALDSLAVRQHVKVGGKNPDAILYVPQARQLYVFNGNSADVTVFDVPSMRIVSTIKVGGRPEFAVSDGAGRIYLNIEDQNAIEVIDIAAGKVVAHWPLAGCEEPTGLALDIAHARLFAACKNKLAAVVDARDGKHVAGFAIGAHPDAVAYDAATGRIYVSNGDSATLTVAQQLTPDRYSVLAQVPTAAGAKTMAFDPATKNVYLPASIGGGLKVLVVAPAEQ
ncbi:YncE family protein [Duganella sp. BJB1802]|uniref:YncE family protein n=1 Tax=Duganella sp. BJB1802 TaxID=2744575 RepID=UPI001592BAE8|nr:YncE family protein [Duganella sp. BJB1802]NVD73406.1 YncE family protein [Duganella sp. BJB1802]